MNTLLERGKAAQKRDEDEMNLIYATVSSGVPPNLAVELVVKREGYELHPLIQQTLTAPVSLGDAVDSKAPDGAKTKVRCEHESIHRRHR